MNKLSLLYKNPNVCLLSDLDIGQAFVLVTNDTPLGNISSDKLSFYFDNYYKGVVTHKTDKEVTVLQISKQSFEVKNFVLLTRCVPLNIESFNAEIDFSIY